ncbi:hypothetical protein PFISCL1PPCAC_12505, partial [Pristionchus fissidentatus]
QMFRALDDLEDENASKPVVSTVIVRRRLPNPAALAAGMVGRHHGIGVHFELMIGAEDRLANYEGTTCGASTHAVIIALEEMLRHPDELDKDWVVVTPCTYLIDGVATETNEPSQCAACRSRGNPDHVRKVCRLLRRFPRHVQLTNTPRNETARQLAFKSIRRLNGKGDSDCSDVE